MKAIKEKITNSFFEWVEWGNKTNAFDPYSDAFDWIIDEVHEVKPKWTRERCKTLVYHIIYDC